MSRLIPTCFALLSLAMGVQAQAPVRTHDVAVDDYFTLSNITQVCTSPDGKHVAYGEERWRKSTNDRNVDLWIVNLADGETKRLTADHAKVREIKWGPDGRSLYFLGSRIREGEKQPPFDGKTQVWKLTLDGGEPSAVTRVDEGIEAFDLPADSLSLFYTTERMIQDDDEFAALRAKNDALEFGHGSRRVSTLWRLDLKTWRAERILDEQRYIREFAVTRDGKKAAMISTPDDRAITSAGRSRVDILDIATRKLATLPDKVWRVDAASPYGRLDTLAWSPNGNRLAFHVGFTAYPAEAVLTEWKDGEPTSAYLARPENLAIRESDAPMQWRGNDELLYLGERKGFVELRMATIRAGRSVADVALIAGDRVVQLFSFADKAGVAVFGTSQTFPEIYTSANFESGRALTKLNSQTANWKLPQVKHVTWKGANGDEVGGVLELPPGYEKGKKVPLIVAIHGGPTMAVTADLQYDMYDARLLFAARGYAVLCPNYRGSTGYGDKFTTDLIGHENQIEIEDILKGVDDLIAQGIVDPEKMAVMGWSNGGYLTNCLITKTNRFKAASSGASILDNAMQWGTNDLPMHTIALKKGFPWDKQEAYWKTSPSYNLGNVRTPTLIHVGGNDERCPPGHGRMLYRALREFVKAPTELVVYPGEPHVLTKYSHYQAKMEWDIAWFDRYVLGNKRQ